MMRTRKQGHVTLAVLAVTVVVVLGIGWSDRAEQIETDVPSCCLLVEGVSWLPVEWLPEGLQAQVTDQTATQTIKEVKFIRIKQFVEAHGGSVGWDSGAGAVTMEFEGQTIPLKALHSGRFWSSLNVEVLGDTTPPQVGQAQQKPAENKQWEPPRLVDGVWVTSGVSDQMASQYAKEYAQEKARQDSQEWYRQAAWQNYYWGQAPAMRWTGGAMQGMMATGPGGEYYRSYSPSAIRARELTEMSQAIDRVFSDFRYYR